MTILSSSTIATTTRRSSLRSNEMMTVRRPCGSSSQKSSSPLLWGCCLLLLGTATVFQPVHAIPLLGGRFETTTDVQSILNLALDAADMKETDVTADKKGIYTDGKNAGFSLASLSLDAPTSMAKNPIYHFFRQAFFVIGNNNEGEPEGKFDGASVDVYGDTIVRDLFDLDVKGIETEAALIMNVWMAAVGELFNAVDNCENQNSALALEALDKAAAYWIGEGQEDGSNERGHMLYNLAEVAGERFGQDDGEAEVNTAFVDTLIEFQSFFKNGSCNGGTDMDMLHEELSQAVSMMTIPLIQMLIHHIMNVDNDGGSDFAELYALSLIPRVAVCDPKTYQEELQMDVLKDLTVNDQAKAIATLQASYSCFQITCDDIGTYMGGVVQTCEDDLTTTLVGYSTTLPQALYKSFVDRDIMQIDILLKYRAFGPAMNWYKHGWNSVYSLQELARNEVTPTIPGGMMDQFDETYGSTTAPHDWIVAVLEQQGEYANASLEQTRSLVTGILSRVVLYLSSVSNLQFAVSECLASREASALDAWDAGVVFYIGSMEGERVESNSEGILLFSTARDLCSDFSTCLSAVNNADATDATSNIEILAGFRKGVESIAGSKCQELSDIVESSIIPQMAVPLFQGVVKYTSYNEDLPVGSPDASLAIGATFVLSIEPMLKSVDDSIALTVATNLGFQLQTAPVADGFDAVTSALRQALESLATECFDIGVFTDEPVSSNLCNGIPTAPIAPVAITQPTLAPVVAPTTAAPVVFPTLPPGPAPTRPPYPAPVAVNSQDIAFGRYVFSDTAVAEGDANFALDVRAMFEAAGNNAARTVYTGGLKAVTTGLSGEVGTISLQSLTTEAAIYMAEDPTFNLFKFSLYSDDLLDTDNPVDFLYADEVVLEAMTNGKDHKLAAEASVVLNVWMAMAHKLHKAVADCRAQSNPEKLIDSVVALWIGKEQVDSEFDTGWMVYSIAQSAHKFYGYATGESPINTKLFELFNTAQIQSGQCTNSPTAFIALRETVNDAIRNLTKPLIKALLFHMIKSTKNMVELYSIAVIPHAAGCNPKTNDELQELLFSGYHHSKIDDQVKDNLADFLRCQRVTCEDIAVTADADQQLASFVNDLCTRIDTTTNPSPMAGYQPKTDVSEYARLDMDTLQIGVFMTTKAYSAARDIYEYGANSLAASGSSLMSLRDLAKAADRSTVDAYLLYTSYFKSPNYADDVVMAGLTQTGVYSGSSRWQLEEIVVRALQAMVTSMASLTYMQSALDKCKQSNKDGGIVDWDVAVALLVGSIEGKIPGQQIGGNGRAMYGLGNEFCVEFNACEASGESTSNEHLMYELAEGRDALAGLECDHLERTLTWNIFPNLSISLVQGVLYFAESNSGLGVGTTDEDVATGHIMSLALEPLVNGVNATAAQVLARNFDYDLTKQPVNEGTTVVYEALTHTVRGMGIDCVDIGQSITNAAYTVCDAEVAAPHQDTPTDLGSGIYVTTTYVQDRANIAKDISDMNEALETGNHQLAELIYKEGKNSEVFDENGKFVVLRSLARFSSAETLFMFDDPVFNLFLFAQKSKRRRLNTGPVRSYANDYVLQTFANRGEGEKTLPAEAALVLNLWMYFNHLLSNSVGQCEERKIRNADGIHLIDEVVAYWIGDGHADGDGERGHLFYALAEEMGDVFKLNESGQSRTNTNILRLFNEAKNELSLPNACSESPTTLIRLRSIVQKISALSAVPLIQGLIHNLRVNDRPRVQLYAQAFVPLVAGCNPSAFEFLSNKLLDFDYNVVEVETIVSHIRDTLPCLGLQCDDIGSHNSEALDGAPTCVDPDRLRTLAGYKPSYDVREYARFDLDLLELDIYMQMGAIKPAQDLYMYGKHVRSLTDGGGSLSLSHLATTSDRSIVDQFDTFTQYYQATDYADRIIQGAFSSAGNAMSDERRRIMVVRSSQVLVMYFGALQAVNEAVDACSNGGNDGYGIAGEAWDKSAALLIGSLEGTEFFGTRHGFMYYDLAQEYCREFKTCTHDFEDGDGSVHLSVDAAVNGELTRLLYAGRGAVLGNSCGGLKKAADELTSLILIPVVQGLLSSSIRISSPSSSNPDVSVSMAEGYVYSRAVLPLVDRVNRDAANTISNNLGSTGPQIRSAVASEVFSAMAKVYNGMDVDCNEIGKPTGFDPCSGVGKIKKEKSKTNVLGILVGVIVALCLVCTVVFFLRSRRKGSMALPENNPKFVAPEGELNHSMDLLQKAFSSNSRPPAETDKLTGETYDASPAVDDDENAPLKESSPDII